MFSPQIPSSQPGRPGIGNVAIRTTRRELDSRSADGIHVQLLWHPLDGHVSVAVRDSKTGEEFELEVQHGQEALAVYHHPFAYAATNVRIAEEGSASRVGARG
jgi:hypothetical protein